MMALGGPWMVLLDACVLAEAAVSDVLLRLAEVPGVLEPRWTKRIWDETVRTCVNRLGWPESVAIRRYEMAEKFFPKANIVGYECWLEHCRNDEGDRHLLAAAIQAKVPKIVTWNRRHFAPEHLEPWGIEAVSPSNLCHPSTVGSQKS